MGFENALRTSRSLLRERGFLVVTEMCWFTDDRSPEAERYWAEHYPDIHSTDERNAQAKALGFEVLERVSSPVCRLGALFCQYEGAVSGIAGKIRRPPSILRLREGDRAVRSVWG